MRKLNILYISTVFPRMKENSTIYTDLVEALVNNGDKVTVVCYDQSLRIFEKIEEYERGAKIFRVGGLPIYNVGMIKKGFGVILLSLFLKRTLSKIKISDFDILLYESPPITLGSIVKIIKSKVNIKTFLMLKDIFPQNAIDMKLLKKHGLACLFFKKKEKILYEVSDYIGCMSKGNMEYLLKNYSNISQEKVVYFPNTKKDNGIGKEKKKDKVRFIYGGNMGIPQGVMKIAPAIRYFNNDDRVEFYFVGRGSEWRNIDSYFKEQKNVSVMRNLNREEYEKLSFSCDVGFIFLDSDFSIPNFPSRILSYMEQGKAILAATDEVTDIRNYIVENDIGLWSNSNTYENLVKNIEIIIENKELLEKYKNNSRKSFLKDFQVEKSVKLLHTYIE